MFVLCILSVVFLCCVMQICGGFKTWFTGLCLVMPSCAKQFRVMPNYSELFRVVPSCSEFGRGKWGVVSGEWVEP